MPAGGAPSSHPPNLTAEFRVLTYRAARDWATWASEQLAQRSSRVAVGQ